MTSFKLEKAEEESYGEVVKKFTEFFASEKNTVFERAKFFSRKQLDGESTEIFLNELLKMSESCELENLREYCQRHFYYWSQRR